MFEPRSDRVVAGRLLLPVLLLLLFLMASSGAEIVWTQEAPFADGLEPDALEDALEPDALEPDVLEPDALGLEPVFLEDLDLPNMHEDAVPLVFCHICLYWVDPFQHHGHRAWLPRPRCSCCHWWYEDPHMRPRPEEKPLEESASALPERNGSAHGAAGESPDRARGTSSDNPGRTADTVKRRVPVGQI